MKRLIIYLAVTFGLTWGLQIPAGIALGAFENGEGSSTLILALLTISMFFPLIGAIAANFADKPEERIDLGFKPRIGGNIRCYLAAWLLPAAISLLGFVVFYITNPRIFDPTMSSYLQTAAVQAGQSIEQLEAQMPPAPVMMAALLFSALTIAPFINMIPAFGEEAGWRGMLFPTLAEHMSTRAAALVSGIIWGLWHAPAIAMGHNYGMDYAGFPITGFLVMTLACTAFGCWLAQLRLNTGSVWPCALAHGALNAVANLGVLFSTTGSTLFGPSPLALVAGIPLIIMGIVCFVRLSAPRKEQLAG